MLGLSGNPSGLNRTIDTGGKLGTKRGVKEGEFITIPCEELADSIFKRSVYTIAFFFGFVNSLCYFANLK